MSKEIQFRIQVHNKFVEPETTSIRKFSLCNPTFDLLLSKIYQDPLLERVLADSKYAIYVAYKLGDDVIQIVSEDDFKEFLENFQAVPLEVQVEFVKHLLPSVSPPPYSETNSTSTLTCKGCNASLPRQVDLMYYESTDKKYQLCKRCYNNRKYLNFGSADFYEKH